MPLLFNLYTILSISRGPGSPLSKGLYKPRNGRDLSCCSSHYHKVCKLRPSSMKPQELPCWEGWYKHLTGPISCRWFNKDCMGEGIDLAQTSPFFRRTSVGAYMAALTLQPFAEGNLLGSWVLRKLHRGWEAQCCPEMQPCSTNCWAQQSSPLLLVSASLGKTTGAAITQVGQWHTEAQLLLWLPHLVCGANRIFDVLLGCYGVREHDIETERHRPPMP